MSVYEQAIRNLKQELLQERQKSVEYLELMKRKQLTAENVDRN